MSTNTNNTGHRNTGDYNTGYCNTRHYNTGNYNTGNYNTGHYNTGDYNTGDRNTGDYNTGDYNIGDYNTGYCNTRHYNTGNYNTGNYNTGHYNTGDYNIGHRNAGHRNAGDYNTGHRNAGNRNAGDYNTGNRNTGDYNTGNYNTGFFCTETPRPMFFDRPADLTWEEAIRAVPYVDLPIGVEFVPSGRMTDDEKAANPTHTTIGGFLRKHERPLRETFPEAWAKMSVAERDRWTSLPNFDAEKFFQITGVDVRNTDRRVITVRTVDGEVVSIYADEMEDAG